MRGIRARADADRDGLVAALRLVATHDAYPGRWPPDPAAWLYTVDVLAAWVAEWEGWVAGHISLRRAGGQMPVRLWCDRSGRDPSGCALIGRLFVTPVARGLGLGTGLLTAACVEAAGRGLHPVLDVVDTNRAAVRLYQRLGWVHLGSYQDNFGGDGPADLLHCFAAPG
jgi:GNAT superfamily N-acetyltransferase